MSAQSTSSSSSKICELCNENASKYCCPRCEVLYCSLECYKSDEHMSCSETFYRDCVNEELAALNTDDESKKKMIEILKKMREGDDDFGSNLEHAIDEEDEDVDSDDNDEDIDLQDRMEGLDLDDADAIWNKLTEDEKNEFEALLSRLDDVGKIIPQWEPWWTYSKDARLVRDMDDNEEGEALKKCPKMVEVPEFHKITNVQPSPSIRYNITNLLASYAFVSRYFNGELEPIEGATYLLNVCDNLDKNTNFDEAALAVVSVKQKCLQSELIETDEASLEVMKRDTFCLLQGPSEENKLCYCRAALSDIHTLLSKSRSALKLLKPAEKSEHPKPTKLPPLEEKTTNLATIETNLPDTKASKGDFSKKFPDHKGDYLPKLDVAKLKKCIKKVEFYLSFVESCGMDFE
ncbi:hypothetical protein O0L34_g11836 [Tuta absoluta]|nr:hypothetical protein O0L34_g11836 [Tuta absoluta]